MERVLRTIENAWINGSQPAEPLPGGPDHQARLSRLLSDILAVQNFALSISRGDLSHSLKARGVVAGSFKALQGSLRHLSWQTRMIAKGDFSQRVDFMGEFSESFNAMVKSLAEAREEIRRHEMELLQANNSLTAEIAERKLAEQALQQAHDTLEERIEERTVELSRANESLAWANRELKDFAFIASHDLHEPLRKIQVLGDRLRMEAGGVLGEEANLLLERMRGSAERMRDQIRALFDYSRLSGEAEPFRTVELDALVGEAVAELGKQIEETKGIIEVSSLPAIEADPGQIRVLFRNLIGNALKFRGERNPAIRIERRNLKEGETFSSPVSGPRCHIFVEDNGIGFEEKYLETIFKPFQRLHRRSEYGGVGMGLAICRKIVERHGGTIAARSTPGEGSTFIVTLPVSQSHRPSDLG